MELDETIISYVVRHDALSALQRAGVSVDDFVGEYRSIWRYLIKTRDDHGTVPSRSTLRIRFPDLTLPMVRDRDLPVLLSQLRKRSRYKRFITILTEAANAAPDQDHVDDAVQILQSELNNMTVTGEHRNHMVNLLDSKTTKRMVKEMRDRRANRYESSILTGLPSFDRIAGGLQPQKMVVIIGRPGLGKSWLDLLFVAEAVMQGRTCILYPLEMTLFETACRLYTLFTQRMFGPRKVLKNLDLVQGNVNTRKVHRMLSMLEDQLPGTLHVADVSSLSDPYTNERIEAEVELYHPDMFWVDYLTLMKPPPRQSQDSDSWAAVRALSNGIKNTAMRQDTIGGCSAQVNREAMRTNAFLPRLENIAYGDSIGQDADQVFSINRVKPGQASTRPEGLYYALVKNRGGPEITNEGRGVRVTWNPNEGLFQEVPQGVGDEDDDD